jgi:hypothetical protein
MLLSLLVVAGGCGDQQHYILAATRSCLDERGYQTTIQDNWVFEPSEGSLVVEFSRQWIVLNFAKDGSEARTIRDSAVAADEALRSELLVRGNVVYGWSSGAKPSLKDVLGCLRERRTDNANPS